MVERWKWAPVKKIKQTAEELKAIIRAKYPDAQFNLLRAEDDPHLWHLWTLIDEEDEDGVRELVLDRTVDLLAEDHIPLYVIPTQSREVIYGYGSLKARKIG
jgi:hypothetical protein